MKKTLSMIIAIAMIAAMLAPMGIFASATGVVEVSTWEEFVAQANANFGEGSYKLTADSAATVSVDGFYGTFDGGDHTITTSTTLFVDVSGPAVIKNFTVNPAKDAGGNEIVFTVNPVIHRVVGSFKDMPVWISGVTNNVSVGLLPEYELDGSSLQDPTGGIIGLTDSENWIYMYNVVNNGNMVSDDQTGGIIGNCGHASGATYLTMVNVVNNGDIFAYNSYAGGIVGNVNAQLYGDFRYCINNGNVSSENDAGGIIGQVNGKSEVSFSYCANSGTIDQNPIITLSDGTERKLTGGDKTGAKYGAAGICPRFSNADVVVTMDNCVIMGVLDNDSTDDNTAYSSADPFNAWNKDNQATITINDCYYLYGMNAVGEYAASLQNTGFFVLEESACKDAFDAIVADASKQPAPEIETPELTPVDLVNVNGYVAPTVGADIAESLAGLSVPDGAPYIINPYWYNETLDSFCREGTFIAGYTYRLYVDVFVASGYLFADDLVMQLNGDASLVDRDSSHCYSEEGYAYIYSVATELSAEGGDDPTESIPVDIINVLGYVAPTTGAAITDPMTFLSVPADAPYSIIAAYWYNDTVNDYVVEENFMAGSGYSLGIEIKFADGYVLADEYTIQFNGDASLCDPEYTLVGDENVEYDLRFWSVITALPAEGGEGGEGGDTPTESIPVDLVNFNGYVAPTVGASIADSLAGLSVPTDAPYSIAELHWLDETTGEMLTEGTFLAGHSYSLGVAFNLADGYALAEDPTFQLNGDATLVNQLASGTGDEFGFDFFYYSVSTELPAAGGEEGGDTPIEPTEKIEIDSVDISGITAPTHGQSVGDYKASLTLVLPEGANYSVRSITITEINPETLAVIDMLADGDVFDSSKTYSVGILVEAGDGYVFATDAVITANGGEYEPIMTLSDGDKAGVAVAFTPAEGGDEPIVIDTINVNGYVAPTAGANIADNLAGLSVPADAPYSIVNAHWYNDTLEDTAYEETFVAGYSYSLCVEIKLANGYVLAAEWTEQLNGNAALVDSQYSGSGNEETDYDLYYYSIVTELPSEGGDEPTEKTEIDKIEISGVTAPEYGKTVADYKASFVPVLPEGANYTFAIMAWIELDPETMTAVSTEVLADDHVFDSTKTYGAIIGIRANEGYVFADDAVIAVNGGKLEVFESMAIKDQALIAIAFNPAPVTGDGSTIAVFAIAALAAIGCVALTLRKKED